MPRLLFEKKGAAIWISHLDLMRLFQRAFKRAGLPLTHTQGFNPRPSVSIALPLSVGVSSQCELLDFDLDGVEVSNAEIMSRLNSALVSGVAVLDVYGEAKKIRELAYLDCCLTLEYDNGVPSCAEEQLNELLSRKEILVEKKSKTGTVDQNIKPMIRSFILRRISDQELELQSRICCQNPSLNPMQLHAAIIRYKPELVPSFTACSRQEIYDTQENVFR